MAYLQIQSPDGSTWNETLNEHEPVTIGRHVSNTIAVDEENIPVLLARILWNRKARGFEITAAAIPDVVISGKPVRSSLLKPGDTVEIGRYRIRFLEEVQDDPFADHADDWEEPDGEKSDRAESRRARKKKKHKPTPHSKREASERHAKVAEPDPDLAAEPQAEHTADHSQPEPDQTTSEAAAGSRGGGLGLKKYERSPGPLKLNRPNEDQAEASVGEWLTRARRPGERDALRSPLITSLTVAGLLLLLSGAALYWMIGRQAAQASLSEARADREAGKYGQAIQRYETFLRDFPASTLNSQARIELGLTRIERSLQGAGTNPGLALEAIESFVEQNRGRDNFRDHHPTLAQYCFRLATTCYRQAGRQFDTSFVEAGDKARLLFARFKATDGSTDEQEQEIERTSRQARAELLEFDVRQQSLAEMDQHLKQQQVAELLTTYRRAVARYPGFAKQNPFISRVRQALKIEQDSIVAELVDAIAEGQDSSVNGGAEPTSSEEISTERLTDAGTLSRDDFSREIALFDVQVSRFDIQSDGQVAWLLTGGMCYGVDRLLGRPLWKVWTGTEVPFEPMDVPARQPSLLLPTASGRELTLVRRATGEVAWQTRLPGVCLHGPTLTTSLVYVVTDQREIVSLELETGQISGRMRFPQPLSAPLLELDERRLLAVAEQDLLYVIDRSNWTCEEVRYHGHAPGSIAVRPFLFNELLLVVESDQLRAGMMRILEFAENGWEMLRRQNERLPGIAVGTPVPWGDRLFLETYGPRVAAWQLSDRPGDPPLRRLTVAPLPFTEDTRLFLAPVEGDRLLVAGETLREMTLLTTAFEQRELSVMLGRTTQSLQVAGTHLQVAGRPSQTQGTVFLHYDFELGESYWRLGQSAPLSLSTPPDRASRVRCVNANGQVFDLERTRSAGNLQWSEPAEQLLTRPSGQAASEEPIRLSTLAGEQATGHAFQQGRQVRLWNPPSGLPQRVTLPGTPVLPVQVQGRQLFWCDERGLHHQQLGEGGSAVESWLFPAQAAGAESAPRVIWQDLVVVDEDTVLGLWNRSRLQTWQIREENRRYLAEAGALTLPEPARGPGCLTSAGYHIALNVGEWLTLDPATLVVRQRTELEQPASGGPWSVGDALYVESGQARLLAYAPGELTQPAWSLELTSPLAFPPQAHNTEQLLLSLADGSLLQVHRSDGTLTQRWQLPSPLSAPPLQTESELLLPLKNGTILGLKQ